MLNDFEINYSVDLILKAYLSIRFIGIYPKAIEVIKFLRSENLRSEKGNMPDLRNFLLCRLLQICDIINLQVTLVYAPLKEYSIVWRFKCVNSLYFEK